MIQIELTDHNGQVAAPRVNEVSLYPNIDDTYTLAAYQGQRLVVRTSQVAGIKSFGTMASSMQGMAIYGNIAVRMANNSVSSTHYVYRVSDSGFSQIASFTLSGTGHSNSLQFAPILLTGQTLPYLYVSDTTTKCYVLSFDSSYQATIVQTITITGNNCQVLIGDDGHIWTSLPGSDNHRKFCKYRRVAVSEGDVTLTDADLLDSWETLEAYPSSGYTAQGWKVKFGRIWFSYGAAGGSHKGISVYDTASHRHLATLEFTSFSNTEWEDIDFYNDSILAAMATSAVYIIKV